MAAPTRRAGFRPVHVDRLRGPSGVMTHGHSVGPWSDRREHHSAEMTAPIRLHGSSRRSHLPVRLQKTDGWRTGQVLPVGIIRYGSFERRPDTFRATTVSALRACHPDCTTYSRVGPWDRFRLEGHALSVTVARIHQAIRETACYLAARVRRSLRWIEADYRSATTQET